MLRETKLINIPSVEATSILLPSSYTLHFKLLKIVVCIAKQYYNFYFITYKLLNMISAKSFHIYSPRENIIITLFAHCGRQKINEKYELETRRF